MEAAKSCRDADRRHAQGTRSRAAERLRRLRYHAHETNADNSDAYHCHNSLFLQLFMDFHVFHASHRFGLFFHVFQQFFVPFFVPAKREKKSGISRSNSTDPAPLGDGNSQQTL
jgi:hypothetical protein